uniref:Uncharacterized protein MANES_06G074000 n=2 Tax=Rhizophora mucronata TaxID=61149 RepID=A0A2P2J672_RHIMU
MFTQQSKASPAVRFTPHRKGVVITSPTGAGASNSRTGSGGKGKAVAFLDGPPLPPPPAGLLSESPAVLDTKDMEDWRRFREVGLLDEAAMERKDREALLEKASRLEKELSAYQYNMGLLLLEKKGWTSKFEGQRQSLAEADEILKREQTAHLIALSEVEKREEILRESLVIEKQFVADLEKTLRSMKEEHNHIKHTSETKLSEAKTLDLKIEEKSLEMEAKMHTAEAKLDEVNRKSMELDTRLQGLNTRENMLHRAGLSLNTEREAHEATFCKQREDFQEWERKLQKKEERLYELQKTLNQSEEKGSENDQNLEQKERDLLEAEKKIIPSLAELKEREENIENQLSDLTIKEKQVDSLGSILEKKEKELVALQEKLSAREREEIENILDKQRAILHAKTLDVEFQLEERRRQLDGELRTKLKSVEQREAEVLHGGERLGKLEQALDKKSERVKEKEKDNDGRLKFVKEREKSVKAEQKKLDLEKQQLLANAESMPILKDDCEKIRAEIAQQELQIVEERESLRIINDERLEHLRLQAELKQQLENCWLRQEWLLKEVEGLKLEREKFEKEWEVLEKKKAQISNELKEINEERKKLEMLQHTEEERLKKEEDATQEYIKRELEAVKLGKESFEARMRHEQLMLSEGAQIEHDRMIQEFESQRSNLETDLISRQEDLEKALQERERTHQEQQEKELTNINYLKEVVQRESEEIQSERLAIENKRQEVAKDKEKLQEQQFGMQNDVKELEMLSKKLRDQREHIIQERDHFLALVEKCKSCKNCGDIAREFVLSDMQPPDMEDRETLPLSRPAVDILGNNQCGVNLPDAMDTRRSSGELDQSVFRRHTSWLQKYTSKILSISPTKKSKDVGNAEDSGQSELKSSRLKSGQIAKAGPMRTLSIKHVVEDANLFLGKDIEEPEHISSGQPSEKAASNVARKRQHAPVENELDVGKNEGCSGSVTTGQRKKRRQMAVPAMDSPGRKRYNLRQHRMAGTTSANLASSDLMKTGKSKVDNLAEVNLIQNPGAASRPPFRGVSETGKSINLGQVTTMKSVEFTQNPETTFETIDIDDQAIAAKSVEITEWSEEVNGTPECGGENETGSTIQVEDDEYDEDTSEHPGEVSMGRKIWTFFTT